MSLLGLAAAAAALAPNATLYSDAMPPPRFRGDVRLVIDFVQPPILDKRCDIPVRDGDIKIACSRGSLLTMPNPCLYADREFYARILCHELAHANGWPATHDN